MLQKDGSQSITCCTKILIKLFSLSPTGKKGREKKEKDKYKKCNNVFHLKKGKPTKQLHSELDSVNKDSEKKIENSFYIVK